MNDIGASFLEQIHTLLPLIAATVGWYLASRLAIDGLASRDDATLRRGAAQCIPVLFVGMTAVVRHQAQLAVGVVFASSVAVLSLVLGVITVTAPPNQITLDARRRWGFVLPAGLLIFLAGYQSQLTLTHAIVLIVEGLIIFLVWTERSNPIEIVAAIEQTASIRPIWIAPTRIILAIVISAIAGWTAVGGAANLLQNSSLPSMSIIAALLIGPALVIPSIGSSVALAQKGRYTDAISSLVAFVLLNLCVILPLLVIAWHVESALPISPFREFWARLLDPQTESMLPFPLIVWRVDAVMLLVLGLAMLPISLGRWLPGRLEGVILILLYAAYMLLWRWASEIG